MTDYKAHEGFVRVTPTADELDEWRRRYPRRSTRQYRLQCETCGKRIWGSGLGIGSHRRGCKGDPGPSQAEFRAALDDELELRRARAAGEVSEEREVSEEHPATVKLTDIAVQNEGSIYILRAGSERGAEWLADNLDEDAQRFGSGYVVEWRFVQAILDGAIAVGLNLKAV